MSLSHSSAASHPRHPRHRHDTRQALPPPDPRLRSNASERSRSTWPSRGRPRPRSCSRVSSIASPSTTTPNGRTAASGDASPCGMEFPGEGGTDRASHRSGRLSDPPRQGRKPGRVGDAALQGQVAPHRGGLSLRRLAGHLAGGPASTCGVIGLDGSPLRHLTLDPSIRTFNGSPEGSDLVTSQLYDVLRHRSPMSCQESQWSGRRESNPRSQLGKLMFCL